MARVVGFGGCCSFAALSRATARAAKKAGIARLRRGGWVDSAPDWPRRAETCERCPLRIIHRGVSHCGTPFLHKPERQPLDGCGCPCLDKAKSPDEHCPLTLDHRPASVIDGRCDCKWCAGSRGG